MSNQGESPHHNDRAGDVGQYAGPARPEEWISASSKLGHSIPTHEAFGWCDLEPGRSPEEELWAWRLKYLASRTTG